MPAYDMTPLIEVMPVRSDRAALMAAFLFPANTLAPRPYWLALARATIVRRSLLNGRPLSRILARNSPKTSAG